MSDHVKNVETPLQYAIRTGIAWNRVNSSALITWDEVVDLAVSSYWRRRCGLPERKLRRPA